MRRFGGALEALALATAAIALFAIVGALNPLPRPGVNTDSLGPVNGDTVAMYVDSARSSVAELTDDDRHWALVSFDAAVSPQVLLVSAGEARIAQVLLRVPMERVQTQVITIGVPGTAQSVLDVESVAASKLGAATGQWDRQSQIDAASAVRLGDGCDCVVGSVVRGTPTELRTIEDTSGVRAVEALPADAVSGRFAVRALLPDYIDIVGPLPDDGPIPPP